jgi:hypothetical protein
MKNFKMNFILVNIFFLFIGGFTFAQKNQTFYALDNTAQSHYLNPAFRPKSKLFISFLVLPVQSFGVSNSGFNLNDMLSKRSQDDSLQLDPDKAIKKMKKLNYLTLESYNEIFAFGIRKEKSYFSFGITNRLISNVIYSKDLFQLAAEGNGQSFLGKRASFDGIGVNVNSYIEYAFGFNKDISEKFTFGGRIKVLSGVANVNTRKSKFGLFTDETTFDLTIDGSATINTSGVKPFYDTLLKDNYNPIGNAYNFKNFGLALDLGATYQVTKKIKVSASLLDLGFINWKTDNATFISNNIDYRFEGVDLNRFLKDSTDLVFDQLKDTLKNVFSREENNAKYKTGLATRFYVGATYDLNEKFNLGATIFNEVIKSKYRAAIIVSSTVKLKNWLSATVNYSQQARSTGNIGIGFSLRGGPFQFYVVTDNVLGFISPGNSKNFHASFGFNFLLGKIDDKAETSKPSFE